MFYIFFFCFFLLFSGKYDVKDSKGTLYLKQRASPSHEQRWSGRKQRYNSDSAKNISTIFSISLLTTEKKTMQKPEKVHLNISRNEHHAQFDIQQGIGKYKLKRGLCFVIQSLRLFLKTQ